MEKKPRYYTYFSIEFGKKTYIIFKAMSWWYLGPSKAPTSFKNWLRPAFLTAIQFFLIKYLFVFTYHVPKVTEQKVITEDIIK